MASQGDLVLITGATGYLGFRVLVEALKAGYRARIAIRSVAKLKKLLNTPSIKALKPSSDQLSTVVVPDMAAPGAYDEAVKGVKYVIHVASPIPTFGGANPPKPEEYEDFFVKPALAGDLGMLKSASKSPTVKRVVLTSSIVAITPFEYYMGQGDPSRVFKSTDRIPFAEGPWPAEFAAYSAGKAAALNAAEEFVRNEKPGFDLVPIVPGWIFGRDELVTEAEGLASESTNSVLLKFLLGEKGDIPYNGNAVLGDDCAKVHVLALNPKIQGNKAYLASVDMEWESALDVLRKEFPEAIKAGKISVDGTRGTIDLPTPSTETEEIFGVKFQPYSTMVKNVAGQYLELVA